MRRDQERSVVWLKGEVEKKKEKETHYCYHTEIVKREMKEEIAAKERKERKKDGIKKRAQARYQMVRRDFRSERW